MPNQTPEFLQAGHRWHTYNWHLRKIFDENIFRISIDAGFTCPNIDGKIARGGCVYCSNESFVPAMKFRLNSIEDQIQKQKDILRKRYRCQKFFAYFQSATNTYGDVAELKSLYDRALRDESVIGLVIGTRPDCLENEILDLIASYAATVPVLLEIGVQTIHDRTLQWMNRGHNAACFFDSVRRATDRGIPCGTHVILGLPGESVSDMLETADALAALPLEAIKVHNLHVNIKTKMETDYNKGSIPILDLPAYIDILIPFLERIPENIVIQRVFGDAPREYLVAPDWVLDKQNALRSIHSEMERRQTWQGKYVNTTLLPHCGLLN